VSVFFVGQDKSIRESPPKTLAFSRHLPDANFDSEWVNSKCVEKFKSSYRNSKSRIKTLEIIVVFLFKIDVHHLKRGVNYAILIAKGGERIEEL
jgi:hypothetical protein